MKNKTWFRSVWKYLVIELIVAAITLSLISRGQMRERLYEAEIYGSSIAANIELTLNQYVSIVESLGDQYLEYGDHLADHFPGICEHIMQRDDAIGSLYIAPDGVIRLAYPLEVNEATIGFEPAKDPEQGAATRFAIESKKTTVAGPHALVEGGTGFIVRYPIYDSSDRFAGLAILVMDWDRFVEKVTKVGNDQQLFSYAVWKENNDGVIVDEDGFIFHAGDVHDRRVQIQVDAPNEIWYLTAEEAGGWGNFREMLPWYLGALGLIVILTYVELSVIRSQENRRRMEAAEAENRAKQQELEEKLKLQEQLLAQKQQKKELDSMITAMASDYRSVYHVNIDADDAVCYRGDPNDKTQTPEGVHFPYHERFTWYCDHYVDDEFQEGFRKFIDPVNVRARLETEDIITYRYLVHRNGADYYEMLRMAGVRHHEDREDNIVHAIGLGFTVIDAEMRENMARNHALMEALAAAEEANKAKSAFLSNMSHEIRTPMNAIIGLNNIAMNEPSASDKVKEYLAKIDTSAHHLLGIINDILDMSRIESGRLVIKSEEFSFAKTLEQVNTIISGQCRDKGLTYVCRTVGKIEDYYIGDDMKLRQVMINILGNAVKFTPEGGTVTFIVEDVAKLDGKSTLRFTMKDTGIGMSREYLPNIFDPFSQEDSSTTSKYGSTGLGMPITKSIVELMNGTIEVESEKDVGTTFTVTVTLLDSNHKAELGEEEGIPHPHEMCVLVIDDDPIACEHAQIILGQVGISCEKAMTGLDGLELVKMRHVRREPYDLILVDLKMPGLDGVETTRLIRQAVGNETPIIILTSYNWEDVMEEAKEAGVDSFVAKPLFAGSVMDEFREAFKKKNAKLIGKTVDLKGRRVLLAEDVAVNAEIMIMVLSMREMEVEHAENGRIAVEKFAASEPGYYDAILMDMRMPEMDGLEATNAIRDMDRLDAKTIPIIALTANAFDEDVQRSMQAGLNAHLSKPVEPEALFETQENLIKA